MVVLIAVALVAMLLGLAPARAGAEVFIERGGAQSATNGIVIGPDGNFWIAEQNSASVLRMSRDGQVLNRFPVGLRPLDLAVSGSDKVWVTVHGAKQLVWFDATAPVPIAHPIDIPSPCPPVAIVNGGDGRMYFSVPSEDGVCNGGVSRLGGISQTGTGAVDFYLAGLGKVFDLAAVGGKVFAPDFDGGVVRRLATPTMAVESTTTVGPGSGPDGVTIDHAGMVWVTAYHTGKVVRFPALQKDGNATEVPLAGALVHPFGITQGGDGNIYVAGTDSSNVARISVDGTSSVFYTVPGNGKPFNIIPGFDADVWMTDIAQTRILRLVSSVPRVLMGPLRATGPTSAVAQAFVNPRGNPTQLVFDYGKTTQYGRTSAPVNVPPGVDAVEATGVLTGLDSDTRYHVRARVINGEGEGAPGADATVKTARFPALASNVTFELTLDDGRARVDAIVISRLRGNEKARVICQGRGCPFKSKKLKKLGKGTKRYGGKLLRGRRFPPGSNISVQITAPRSIGLLTTLQLSRGKGANNPRATKKVRCLEPGAKKPSKCP